jgi:hypothetical protein
MGLGGKARALAYPLSFALVAYVTQGTSATFTNGVGATFRMFAGQARFCVEPNPNRWRVAGCTGMQLGLVRTGGYIGDTDWASAGYESAVTFVRYRWIPAPLVSVNMGYDLLANLTLEFGADLVLPLSRRQFVVENLAPLFRPAAQQYLLYLGLGLHFD